MIVIFCETIATIEKLQSMCICAGVRLIRFLIGQSTCVTPRTCPSLLAEYGNFENWPMW